MIESIEVYRGSGCDRRHNVNGAQLAGFYCQYPS